ncbi:MAG: SpoIID/LytB domain-containing protein [Clostridia bacterium]
MWKTRIGKAALLVSALSLSMPLGSGGVQAAKDHIRVALFIDTGIGYRGVVPAVTLSSEGGLKVELASEDDKVTLPETKGTKARFKVDQLQLTLLETTKKQEAERILQLANQGKIDASLQMEGSEAKPLYRVVSGSFETYQAAQAQSQKAAQALGVKPRITGPYHLDAGHFDSLKEAQKIEAVFENAGVSAHVAMLPQGKNKTRFAVWVGSELNKEALGKLTIQASSILPNLKYKTATAKSYVLVNRESKGGETLYQYAFAPESKLIVSPKKSSETPLIGVEERDKRTYRGEFELSKYKGNLTVINELSLEQYLYGVVGTEMSMGWPLEALKTQAVLARTHALKQGNKYGIANVSDTANEQVYGGYLREAEDIRRAVDATEGEVIRYNGKLAEALYYSNAGGMTADGTEVWGNPVPYLRSVESPDTEPQEKAMRWYRAALANGAIGYIRSDLVNVTGTNPAGLPTGLVNTNNLNFRNGPSTLYHKVLQTLPIGTLVTILNEEPEENAYSWTRGPYTAEEITAMINASQVRNKAQLFVKPISSLSVSSRGPSGRVLQIVADGVPLTVSSPDAIRSIFKQGDSILRSGKFEIVEQNDMAANGFSSDFVVNTGANEWDAKSKSKKFLIRGYGFGHGLGVSQYGAKALAERGLDYMQILAYYYTDVTIGR